MHISSIVFCIHNYITHKKYVYSVLILLSIWIIIENLTLVASEEDMTAKKDSSINAYPINDPRHIWDHVPRYDAEKDASLLDVDFGDDFLFGLAIAASHVEDNLNDIWQQFAFDGGIKGFHDVVDPYRRVDFFSDPEKEIALAQKAGAKVLRLSISWSRLMPKHPLEHCQKRVPCKAQIQDYAALERYRQILHDIRSRGMKVMLTLFHHDLPVWSASSQALGYSKKSGWLDPHLAEYFHDYAEELITELENDIDYLITFNEPTLFSTLTHLIELWPPSHFHKSCMSWPIFDVLSCYPNYVTSIKNIAHAHRLVYQTVKRIASHISVGVSHSTPYIANVSEQSMPIIRPIVNLFIQGNRHMVLNDFPDSVIEHLDFLGINHYSEETGNIFHYAQQNYNQHPYSDAGRLLNANGLYYVLNHFHNRYKDKHKDLYYIITENGIADDSDLVRIQFLTEHLRALSYSIKQGIPVRAYLFWTISDNWEWSDGYCPKFGLVHVERLQNLQRVLKPSYSFFQGITQFSGLTKDMIQYSNSIIEKTLDKRKSDQKFAYHWDGKRAFCRNADGVSVLDKPLRLPLPKLHDWNFQLESIR